MIKRRKSRRRRKRLRRMGKRMRVMLEEEVRGVGGIDKRKRNRRKGRR